MHKDLLDSTALYLSKICCSFQKFLKLKKKNCVVYTMGEFILQMKNRDWIEKISECSYREEG